MKTVNKIILLSCVFCYFAGIWLIASKLGITDELMGYSPEDIARLLAGDFPYKNYFYIGLSIYTVLYACLVYIIYRVITQHDKDMGQLAQETTKIVDLSERINMVKSTYMNHARQQEVTDANIVQKLNKLQRIFASMPPAVTRDASLVSKLCNCITRLNDMLDDNCEDNEFSKTLDEVTEEVNAIKRKGVSQ